MTELIDHKRILNVSLEGDCKKGQCSDGTCEGFYFTDPPFTLLTTEVVLPGIPLARIKPMESYLPFNKKTLRSSFTNRGNQKIKTKEKNKMNNKEKLKIKVHVKEERDPAKMGHTKPASTGRDTSADASVYKTAGQGTSDGPSGEGSTQFRGNLQSVSQQTNVAMGADPAESKPEGVWQTEINNSESNPAHEGVTGTPLKISDKDKPKLIGKDPPMPKVDSHIGPTKTGKVNPDLTTSSLPAAGSKRAKPVMGPDTHPGEPSGVTKIWRDGTDKRPDKIGVYSDKSFPHEDATAEKVRRIKAELKAEGLSKNLEYVESVWIDKYTKLSDSYQKLYTSHKQLETLAKELRQNKSTAEQKVDDFRRQYASKQEETDEKLRATREKYDEKVQELKIEINDYKTRYGASVRESKQQEKMLEDYRIDNAELKEKYHGSLAYGLKTAKDLTQANEDYIEKAKECEKLKEALQRAKILSKKTLKIKV
jgi:hypothetical protein